MAIEYEQNRSRVLLSKEELSFYELYFQLRDMTGEVPSNKDLMNGLNIGSRRQTAKIRRSVKDKMGLKGGW